MSKNKRMQRRSKRRCKRQQIWMTAITALVAISTVAVLALSAAGNTGSSDTPGAGLYDGIPRGVTEDGLYRLGAADAPVLMEEFSGFTCPHCANFHDTVHTLIDPYVKDGTLAVVFAPLGWSQTALLGAQAAICAGQQDPIKFWEMHDMLFSWQASYGIENIEAAAVEMGLDVAALRTCMDSPETTALLQGAADEATARGVGGTPAIFFNGERPDCSPYDDPLCEGNLPYDMVINNIEIQLGEQ